MITMPNLASIGSHTDTCTVQALFSGFLQSFCKLKPLYILSLLAVALLVLPVNAAWTFTTENWTDTTIQSSAATAIMWNTTGTYTWTAPAGVTEVWYLVVAGGGAGGGAYGGGGGAGGLLNGTYTVTPGTVYNITVGSGGLNSTNVSGQNSSFANITPADGFNAKGGGSGGNNSVHGGDGGSSGGGGLPTHDAPGTNVTGQGFKGSYGYGDTGSGGAGGSSAGQPTNATTGVGANSVNGIPISINGSLVYFASGGGGSGFSTAGTAGLGGGGAGSKGTTVATKGTDGLGGGGGGGFALAKGGSGGNGTVIIRYRTIDLPVAAFTASPTSGTAALLVQFTDQSTNETPITSWNWSFGDYSYSDERNPQHVYSTYGVYDVNLTITTAEDTVWLQKNDYIVTSTPQGTQGWYTPHQVKFTVVDKNYHDVEDATINASAIASTFPEGTNWLVDLYGMEPTDANDMLNGTLLMGGTTGSDGGAVFTMLSSISYIVKVQHPVTMEYQSVNVSPIDSEYTIRLTGAAANNTYTDMGFNTTLNVTEPDVNHVTMHLFYQDMSGNTNLLEFFVVAKVNNTLINYQKTSTIGTNVIWMNYTVPNVKPNQYSWYYNAVRVG